MANQMRILSAVRLMLSALDNKTKKLVPHEVSKHIMDRAEKAPLL
jgi:hypothetical protein